MSKQTTDVLLEILEIVCTKLTEAGLRVRVVRTHGDLILTIHGAIQCPKCKHLTSQSNKICHHCNEVL
jgi:hypothetical protein